MHRFALIYNPRAKRNRKFPWRMYRYRSIVRPVGDFILSENLNHLDEIVADLKRKEFDLIGVCGGDGSIQKTVTSVIRQWGDQPLPDFALVKGGTMNTVITALGLHGMGRSYLRRLVRLLKDGTDLNYVFRPMLHANNHFAFMFGLGLATRLLLTYYRGGGGARTVVKIITRAAGSVIVGSEFARWVAEPIAANVRVNGNPITENRFTAILAGTIDRYPLGFRLLPRALEKPDCFHLRLTTFPLSQYLVRLPQLHRGLSIQDSRLTDYITPLAEIETAEEEHVILDGEIMNLGRKIRLQTGMPLRFVRS